MCKCFYLNAQIKTGTYKTMSDSNHVVFLELHVDSSFLMYPPACCYSSGILSFGKWFLRKDTLILSYNKLEIRKPFDTTKSPVKYTDGYGQTFTVTNGIIIVETKKYFVRNGFLLSIIIDDENKSSNWGNYNFVLEK